MTPSVLSVVRDVISPQGGRTESPEPPSSSATQQAACPLIFHDHFAFRTFGVGLLETLFDGSDVKCSECRLVYYVCHAPSSAVLNTVPVICRFPAPMLPSLSVLTTAPTCHLQIPGLGIASLAAPLRELGYVEQVIGGGGGGAETWGQIGIAIREMTRNPSKAARSPKLGCPLHLT